MIDIVSAVTVVMISQVYAYVQIDQNVLIKYMFSVSLYLNEA